MKANVKAACLLIAGITAISTVLPAFLSAGEQKAGADINSEPAFERILDMEENIFSPSVTADGKTMVFNAKEPGEKYYNIYISHFENGKWSDPAALMDINSSFNDETPYITPDGLTIVFASDRNGSIRPSKTADGKIRATTDIYMSVKIKEKWTKPVPVPGSVNTIANERTPSLSPDKRTLYFTRWGFDSVEDSKICKAVLKGHSYVKTEVLPVEINSGYGEMAPVPAPDGSGLFFSSRRPGGFGEWDLYFTPVKNGSFGKAYNLGEPFNSTGNDLFLSNYADCAFIGSDRGNAAGRYSVFCINRRIKTEEYVMLSGDTRSVRLENDIPSWVSAASDNKIYLYVIISDKHKGTPISAAASIKLKDKHGKLLQNTEQSSDRDGVIRIFPQNGRTAEVQIDVIKKGYRNETRNVTVAKGIIKEIIIELDDGSVPEPEPVQPEPEPKTEAVPEPETAPVPEAVPLPEPVPAPAPKPASVKKNFESVAFKTGSAEISTDRYQQLYTVIDYMYAHKKAVLHIKGWADKKGTDAVNLDLSSRRACAVKRFIAERGISEDRIKAKGMNKKDLKKYRTRKADLQCIIPAE